MRRSGDDRLEALLHQERMTITMEECLGHRISFRLDEGGYNPVIPSMTEKEVAEH